MLPFTAVPLRKKLRMKTRPFVILGALLVGASLAARADEESSYSVSGSAKAQSQWNTDPRYWEKVLHESKEFPDVKLGKSDFTVGGPLVDGLRRRKSSPDLSLGKRFLRLPIVRLFVPQPMPSPPGGGRYFVWGDSSRPWTALAEGVVAADPSNPLTREPRSLISIRR